MIKLLLNVFPLWISSNDLSFIYPKNILKCFVTTVFMPSITSRRRIFADAFQKRNNVSFCVIATGVHLSFCPLAMIPYIVLHVVLPCRFWKFTTKKLHYLNNIERPCVPDNSKIAFISIQSDSAATWTETKNYIYNVMAKSLPSLFCHVIFYFLPIIHYLLYFANFPINQKNRRGNKTSSVPFSF